MSTQELPKTTSARFADVCLVESQFIAQIVKAEIQMFLKGTQYDFSSQQSFQTVIVHYHFLYPSIWFSTYLFWSSIHYISARNKCWLYNSCGSHLQTGGQHSANLLWKQRLTGGTGSCSLSPTCVIRSHNIMFVSTLPFLVIWILAYF